jgi:NitT/TauT family transport system permease protein
MALDQDAVAFPVEFTARDRAARLGALGRLVLLPLGFALATVLAWELVCRTIRISPALLPPPSAVWSVLSGNWQILYEQSLPTVIESVVSFAVASLLASLWRWRSPSAWVREALYPNIVMLQLIRRSRRTAIHRVARRRR